MFAKGQAAVWPRFFSTVADMGGTDSRPRRYKVTFFPSEIIMSGRSAEIAHFSMGRLDDPGSPRSSADPDVLARAVRAHKLGDAVAQAALTFALMLAIGAVAFVLSAEHAAAASQLIVNGVIDNSAVLLGLAGGGVVLLLARQVLARQANLRLAQARIARSDAAGAHATRLRSR